MGPVMISHFRFILERTKGRSLTGKMETLPKESRGFLW